MDKIKILLVDDDQKLLAGIKKLLTKKGYDVVTASNGAEALEMIRIQNIHVVILDVKMPGITGIEVLKEIKQDFPLIQVIMLTGHATVYGVTESLKFGATDYLLKPINIEELLQKTGEAFEKRARLEQKIRKTQIEVLEHQFKGIDSTDNYAMNQVFEHLTRLKGVDYGKNENDAGG